MLSFGLQSDLGGDVQVGTVVFYLGTASVLAAVGRLYRMRLERDELAARMALEAAQERTLVLVGELDRLSREDSLTGVANRRAWDEALKRSCAEAERTGRPLSVLLLDIDRFKEINDEHGHRRGDEVLQAGLRMPGRTGPAPRTCWPGSAATSSPCSARTPTPGRPATWPIT